MSRETIIEEALRIEVLSPTLLRVEERGPAGFEDRTTFHVADRSSEPFSFERVDSEIGVELRSEAWRVVVEGPRPGIECVRIHDPAGVLLFDGARPIPSSAFLPEPGQAIGCWAFQDTPRIVPPSWGALPPPAGDEDAQSGWDCENQARDVYIFLPGAEGYRRVVADFLRLTGKVSLPPLCAFGLIDSRYHPYRQDEALETIDTYRAHKIPLDIFVLDTDWRVGASHGYAINTQLLPDLEGFLREAHARGIRVMLNDHPEPHHPQALSPEELRYRWEGLSGLLKLGVDYWWFDRNWHVSLGSPAAGLSKEVWGMRLYHDVARAVRPHARPMVLSNVEGIDNGFLKHPPSPSAHRYPIWWTGDTRADWKDLARGVRNAVNGGLLSLLPYISEDLGGHVDMPDEELYARFVQFGALSPVCRLHCTAGMHRYPWRFGAAGEIAADYIRLRYRLLPTIYAAAHEAYEHGRPLLRRCDLEWPSHPEATSSTQYLLGDDLLVAPILEPVVPLEPVPATLLSRTDGKNGVDAEYFAGDVPEGAPAARAIEADICHTWHGRHPVPGLDVRRFAARWETILGPIPESGLYRIAVKTQGRVRMWIDRESVLDCTDPTAPVFKFIDRYLHQGSTHAIRIEYASLGRWGAQCEFVWGRHQRAKVAREIWLPPGAWTDVWTGEVRNGPATIKREAALPHVPMYARGGGVIFSIPPRETTGAAYWPELTLDLFPHAGVGACIREVVEDDGQTVEYASGVQRRTRVVHARQGDRIVLTIEAAHGSTPDAPMNRDLVLRWHGLPRSPTEVRINERPSKDFRWIRTTARLPIGGLADRAGALDSALLEIKIPSHPVREPLYIELPGLFPS